MSYLKRGASLPLEFGGAPREDEEGEGCCSSTTLSNSLPGRGQRRSSASDYCSTTSSATLPGRTLPVSMGLGCVEAARLDDTISPSPRRRSGSSSSRSISQTKKEEEESPNKKNSIKMMAQIAGL